MTVRHLALAALIWISSGLAGAGFAQPAASTRSTAAEPVISLIERGEALRDSRPADAARLAEEALERFGHGPADILLHIRAMTLASRSHTRLGNYERALDLGLNANRMANRTEITPRLRADVHDSLGLAYQRLGSMGDALLEFRKAFDLRDQDNAREALVSSLTNIAGVHALSGQHVEALEHYEVALAQALALNLETVAARIRVNIAFTNIERGAPERAKPYLEEVLAFATRSNNALFLAHGNQNMGETLYYLGQLDAAEDHLLAARKHAQENGLMSVQSDSEEFLGRVALARGDIDGAMALAQTALEHALAIDEPQRLEDIHFLMYRAAKAQGDFRQAVAHLEESNRHRDFLFSQESDRRLSLLNAQFGLTEKQHEIDLLQQDKEIQSLQLERQRQERNLILSILLASGIIILGLGLGLRSKIKSNWEVRKKSDELEEARRHLAQASEAKSELLATTSHEIRTPLNGILGMTELLLSSEITETQKNRLEAIRDSGQAMANLLEDILDKSKIEAGRIDIRPTDLDLPEFLHLQSNIWHSFTHAKGLELRLDFATDLPRCIRLDANRLRQILLNFVSNAVKFTQAGGVTVSAVNAGNRNGRRALKFSVTDTGPGLTEDQLERIFQPYHGSSGLSGSAGLGLHICRKLARKMGGEIGVDTTPGVGCRFWVIIPVEDALGGAYPADATDKDSVRPDNVEAPNAADAATGISGRHILVVDDNEINRRLFAAILNSVGMTWDEATGGRDAIDKLKANSYDLILMDLRMPGMDGAETTRIIRDMNGPHATVPILAVTADTGEEEAAVALTAGMDSVITKPIKPDTLLARIAEILDNDALLPSQASAS